MSLTPIFFALVAALLISYFLNKKGYYHIFYFSLCLLLVVDLIVYGIASEIRTHSREPESYFLQVEFLEWLQLTIIVLSIITILFSVINLFIPENKRSVKIISGIIVGLAITGVIVFIYAIANMGKIGG